MSNLISELTISGTNKLFQQAEIKLKQLISEKGEEQVVSFPDTAFYLPLANILFGLEVKCLKDIFVLLENIKFLMMEGEDSISNILQFGQAAILCEEIICSLKYLTGEEPQKDCSGFISDNVLRTLGIQLVDGRMSGVAVILGAAIENKLAVEIVREFQQKNILTLIGGNVAGRSIIDQLKEENIALGLETYIVPFGRENIDIIYPLNWAIRAAAIYGGIKPGKTKEALNYCKERIFAFGLVLGEFDDIKVSSGAGAISMGFPIIADTDIPEIKPVLIKQLDYKKIVKTCIEIRGLKIKIKEIPIPVPYSAAFEGERVRREQTFVQFGNKYSLAFELVLMKEDKEVEDGKIELIGKDIDQFGYNLESQELPFSIPLGILVEVSGKKMQKDYETILERQIHHFINFAMGIFHMGQRDQIWIRISKEAFNSGFRIKHLGTILHSKFLEMYPELVDKVQIKIFTNEEEVRKLLSIAEKVYTERDERLFGMTDESVEVFYSCTLCQSFAPNHVCVITPERLGLCGAYNWLDGKVAYEINPKGMNQPINKGTVIDEKKGEWEGVNKFVFQWSNRSIERFCNYSIMEAPTTSCGCFECIVAVIPECNGVMVVNRGYQGMTPVGMTFTTLASSVGGGNQVPGFLGIGKLYLVSKKFLVPEGGLRRVVWMTKELKEFLSEKLKVRCEEIGENDLIEKIADETVATDSVELLKYLQKVNHPALNLPPLL